MKTCTTLKTDQTIVKRQNNTRVCSRELTVGYNGNARLVDFRSHGVPLTPVEWAAVDAQAATAA
jgi:hypothetical protein